MQSAPSLTPSQLTPFLQMRRDHAFLLPEGGRLPFDTRAPIFYFE
jgi:hypothetical protein